MTRIGFIGLGNMGGHMARNLLASEGGYALGVFDVVPELMKSVSGADTCASIAEVSRGRDVIISMLPAGRHVREVYLGQDGVLAHADDGTLLIDCSTIDPATARDVAAAAAERGLGMLDAPVSGGTAGAEAGTLTFIVGGEGDVLERARPCLEVMGRNIFHAGAAGAGQIAKICNNMLLAIHMAGTSEALALGVANGLDPTVLSDIMKQSSGGNWSLNVYNPYPGVMEGVPASRGYAGGFLVDLMTKDLQLAMDTAEGSRSAVPLGSLAKNLYRLHQQENDAGRLDFSSIQWLFAPALKQRR
ncbi:MAG: 3-hydroxyisobutyrate dehydrogenase [Pseudomonadales bacterium]